MNQPLQRFSDPRDQVLLNQNPTLMMPRFGQLPDLQIGQRRYVMARDGVYIQAKSPVLSITAKLADTPPMPYGALHPSVEMIGGLVPGELVRSFQQSAIDAHPVETAGFVIWKQERQEYLLYSREGLSASSGHISYLVDDIDYDTVVCDFHSHGQHPAYFSTTDDVSDNFGVYFASVFGRCDDMNTMEMVTRIVIDGYHIDVPWHPWDF